MAEEAAVGVVRDPEALKKLATKMGTVSTKKLVLIVCDMTEEMLAEAVKKADETLEGQRVETEMARVIKKHFDTKYLPPWHVIVGKKFGSHVTHEVSTFAHFVLENMAFLIFRGIE